MLKERFETNKKCICGNEIKVKYTMYKMIYYCNKCNIYEKYNRDVISSTDKEILEILKQENKPVNALYISKLIFKSRNYVNERLIRLEKIGKVKRISVKIERGRPRIYWRIKNENVRI